MERPRIPLWTGAIVLAMTGVVILLFAARRPVPSYEGKPLSYWFKRLPCTVVRSGANGAVTEVLRADQMLSASIAPPPGGPQKALEAIRAMGGGVQVFLLDRLQTRETPWKLKVDQMAARLGYKGLLFEPALVMRGRAVAALDGERPLPDATRKALQDLSTNADMDIAVSAKYLLRDFMGSPGSIHATNTVISSAPAHP